MKSRLLIIHRALAPYRVELFNELSKAFDCRIYFEYDTPLEQSFQREQLDARRRFDYEILPKGDFGVANLRTAVFKIVREFRPNIILSSEFNLITPLLWLAKELYTPHAKLIAMCDDSESMAQKQIRTTNAKSFLIRNVDGIVLCDKRAKELYASHYSRGNRMYYLPILQDENVLRRSIAAALPRAMELREQFTDTNTLTRIMLYVGRLAAPKNLHSLIRILPEIFNRHPSLRFVVVGDGPEEGSIHALISELALSDKIIPVGKHEGVELMAYYALADFFVLPSTYEPFGAVTNEALIAGLRVAISRIAGSSPLIDESNGTCFDPLSISEMREAIETEIKIAEGSPETNETLRPSLMPTTFLEAMSHFIAYLNKLD